MRSVREDIVKEHPAIQKSDIVVFFQVADFISSFQFYKYSTSKVSIIIWTQHISWHAFLYSSFKLKYFIPLVDLWYNYILKFDIESPHISIYFHIT